MGSVDDSKNVVVIIGAMKCGTSSLHEYLTLHPDISMSRPKELNFFVASQSWSKGIGWYRSKLSSSKRVVGESSPNYTKHPTFPGVPERMHALLPDARLIFIARDPVRRILSHFHHNLSNGRERRPIDEALATPATNPYVYPSLYHQQAQRFLEVYRRDQMLLLDLKQLSADPRGVLRRCFEFIGVDAGFDHPSFGQVHHSSDVKGVPTDFARRIAALPGGVALRSVIPQLLEKPLETQTPSDTTRRALEDAVRADAARFRELSGLPFADWCV
jgi:hypothetical protein